jgi:hypothetical protein
MNKDYLEVGQKLYYGVLTFDKIDVEECYFTYIGNNKYTLIDKNYNAVINETISSCDFAVVQEGRIRRSFSG